MARRSGGTHKGVEEKRRSLPIYQHYTLSPGKTKSHHPEAKCNHCLKEFVCGSKQRLIRHLRKCNSISNPEQIIAETLNTLARNSATGTLNHSILEASNLLPSQIPQHHLQHQHLLQHQQQQQQQQLVGQQHLHHHPTNTTTANNSNVINNSVNNHNTSGSSNDTHGLIASSSSNGSQQPQQMANSAIPVKRSQRRGRKPNNRSLPPAGIHVTTGLDGKTHFTPASQLPQANLPIASAANATSASTGGPVTSGSPAIIAQVHNGRSIGFTYHPANAAGLTTASPVPPGAHLTTACGGGVNTNHHHSTATQAYKLNSDPIDKAYLKLVLTRNLPLSLCDTKEFQLWVKTFANDYKPPSSINLIAQNLKNEAQTARQRISNILVKAPKKTINLELHSWPEELRRHLWFAVIANVDHKRFLISIRDIYMQNQQLNPANNNNTTSLSSAHQQSNDNTSDKVLAEFIDDCFKRIGSDRINSLIFTASNTGDSLTLRARQALYTTHPSIVTYHCWWHFTNLLCADIVENNATFQHVMRNSNRLINYVNKRPKLALSLEKFSPFAGVASSIYQKKNDRRWYSHLVCYLLEYIKNNNEAIIRALGASTIQSQLASDNNNNSSSGTGNNSQTGVDQHEQQANSSTQQQTQTILYQEDAQLIEIKSIIMSSEYWTNLNLALNYLKPIHDIVALTSTVSTQSNHNNNNNNSSTPNDLNVQQLTPVFSPTVANGMSLSDYMNWFLRYGKTLIDSWRQSPNDDKCHIIGRYLARFNSSITGFKLLFAAYLLNPKHRCAFMTQQAKNTAIEEILNVASEFMPEESDGHTIFDQWKLYLVREEPYDMVYEENRSTPLEWWMSLPCAESIRRVALRILRLKAFTSPKPETLFSQLYFYEDETKSSLIDTTFEDTAVLRYFYDYEDKVVQTISQQPLHNHSSSTNNASNSFSSNGFHDRTQVGQLHNEHLNQSNYSSGGLDIALESNGQIDESLSINESRASYTESFSDVVDPYLGNHHHPHLTTLQPQNNLGVTSSLIEDLPGYDLFIQYIDYNETGVQIVEEPIEKKKRKWTAQEILSKCQSNHQNNNNNDINSK